MLFLLSTTDTSLKILQAIFWLCVALVAYVYAGYPLLLKAISCSIRRLVPELSDSLHITLLICAHNEAASIGGKLRNTLSLNYPSHKLQILVVSDGSTDGTDEIVRSFAIEGVELLRIETQRGKTHAQNTAMQHARGEIVVFSDATTRYNPNALRALAGNYANPFVGAVSGSYVYVDPAVGSPNAAGATAYASYDNRIRAMQSHIWSLSGCCGCIYSIRLALYTPLEEDVISDLVQPLHVLRQGYRVTYEPRAQAWETATATTGREFSMRVRVVARALAGIKSVHQVLSPWHSPWIALQMWSHKILRWTIPIFLMGALFSSLLLLRLPFFRAVLVLEVLFYGTALLMFLVPSQRRWRSLSVPLYFCTVNAAAIGGIVQYLRGHRYSIWSPDRKGADVAHGTL